MPLILLVSLGRHSKARPARLDPLVHVDWRLVIRSPKELEIRTTQSRKSRAWNSADGIVSSARWTIRC